MVKKIRKPLALFLALVMCLSMVNFTALANETADHEHNADGWTCTQAEPVKTLNCEEDHEHTDDCYTVTEGEWTCVAPVVEETPAEVTTFLNAVAGIPAITAENAAEVAEYVYGPVSEAYEALLSTGYEERADVLEAVAAYAAAIDAVDAALDMEDETYGSTQYQPYKGARITQQSGSAYAGATRNQARITAFVGEKWNFQRLPTNTYYGSRCGHAMFICAPKYYNYPSLRSYDDTIVQDDGYTIGTWNDNGTMWQMDGSDCLQWNFTALKPGMTTAQSHYYVRWDNYSNVSGGCPVCGWSTKGFDNRGMYYEYQDNIPITVYARYQLNYDTQGGSYVTPTYTDESTESATLAVTGAQPTKSGYTFKGWSETSDGKTPAAGSYTLNWSTGLGGKNNPVSKTLYAIWEEAETYTVTYTDGVTGETVFADQGYENLKEGDNTPEFVGTPTRKDYTFMGWNPAVNSKVSADDADDDGNIVYTATWQKNEPEKKETTYTVYHEYYTNGERDGATKGTAVNGTVGQVVQVSDLEKILTYKKGNDTYTYTYTQANKGIAANNPNGYTLGEEITALTLAESGNIIVLRYDRTTSKTINYTLIYAAYDAEKAEVKNLPASETKQGTAPGSVDFTVSSQIPTREGYTFNGWRVQGTEKHAGDTVTMTASASASAATETLYATWTKNPEKPDKPTHQDVRNLVGAPVTVHCDTENVSNNTFGYHSTDAQKSRVTIGEVQGDANGYTCQVTFLAQKFCEAYNALSSVTKEHTLADGQGNVTLTLTWDTAAKAWKLPMGFVAPVTIHVVCQSTPPVTNPSLSGLTKVRVTDETQAPAGTPSDVEYGAVIFRSDDQKVKLLYKITVTGTEGAQYKVVDEGAKLVTGSSWTGTIDDSGKAVIYVTKEFDAAAIKDGKLTNTANLESNDKPTEPGKPGTEGPGTGDGKDHASDGGTDASEKRKVEITFKTDDGTELDQPKVEKEYNKGDEFDGISVNKPATRKMAPRATAETIVIPWRIGDYVLDEVASAAALKKLNELEFVTEDVLAELIYSKDVVGTTGTDSEGNPTDTSDGIPDKYQVKVTFKVVNGKWTDETTADVVKYVVKYKDGVMATDGTATLGDIIPAVGDKPDDGFKAGSWNTTLTAETEIKADAEYVYTYAKTTIPMEIKAKYLVQWLNEAGEVMDSKIRGPEEIGTKVTVTAEDKILAGYTFDAENANNVLEGTLSKTEVVILKLYFTKNPVKHTVTFDSNGGSPVVGQTVEHGDKATRPADPTRDGYTFDGWTLNGQPYDFDAAVIGDITLVARWTQNTRPVTPDPDYTYTLNYNANGGVGAPTAQSQTNNRNFTISAVEPTREGYTFAGWALTANAEEAAYQPGEQIRINTGFSLTLHAVWTPVEDVNETEPPLVETPDVTETPDEGEDLGDNDTPLTELPDETEPPVEPTETPDETEDLDEGDTPLAEVPQTGDSIALWIVLTLCSAAGLYCFFPKKKKGQREI